MNAVVRGQLDYGPKHIKRITDIEGVVGLPVRLNYFVDGEPRHDDKIIIDVDRMSGDVIFEDELLSLDFCGLCPDDFGGWSLNWLERI